MINTIWIHPSIFFQVINWLLRCITSIVWMKSSDFPSTFRYLYLVKFYEKLFFYCIKLVVNSLSTFVSWLFTESCEKLSRERILQCSSEPIRLGKKPRKSAFKGYTELLRQRLVPISMMIKRKKTYFSITWVITFNNLLNWVANINFLFTLNGFFN